MQKLKDDFLRELFAFFFFVFSLPEASQLTNLCALLAAALTDAVTLMLRIAPRSADSSCPVPAYFGDISCTAVECAGWEHRALLGADGVCPQVWARHSAVE